LQYSLRNYIKPKAVPLFFKAIITFNNFFAFFRALTNARKGNTILKCRDGIHLIIRNNIIDAKILIEVFLEKVYLKYFSPGPNPIIVDIGAYIGDFSIYAAKNLNAHLIAYEPALENFLIFEKNIQLNSLSERIKAINKAVGERGEIILNVKKDGDEIYVSSHMDENGEKRKVQSDTLEDVLKLNNLTKIDLLKIDCDGGEYEIFASAPEDLFANIRNIVFEYHKITNYERELIMIIDKLRHVGFRIKKHGMHVYAYRD